VHFLALGALVLLLFEWRGGASDPESNRIAITPARIEQLASAFAMTWQRPPTDEELKGLIDNYVKDEIATREASAIGLDQDDVIIRRRLRQKLEFLVEDATPSAPPTDAELGAWLDAHPDRFPAEPRVALRQVYLSPERRGESAQTEAARLLARLVAAGPNAPIDAVGDPSLLPREMPLAPLSEVARTFGPKLAAEIDEIPPGEWTGPLESSFGLHLVLVPERVDAARPSLAEVRPLVERELLAERRRAQLADLYERLLQKYTVSIERPTADAASPRNAPTSSIGSG
jgi:hypothetical protein